MNKTFPPLGLPKGLLPVAVALGMLAGPAAFAQAPTVVYALGNNSSAASYFGIPAGAQTIGQFSPTNPSSTSLLTTTKVITGIAAGQKVVGIDVRPNTGQLYALGYNSSAAAANAQLYTLDYNTGQLTAVGGAITLNLADDNRANTQGYLPNVGFDFNPRVDRIRVVAPNRTNYRLNPNTGVVAAIDGTLTYAPGNSVGHDPYIGTAAYTNSALGVPGTTLFDIDVTAGQAILSDQTPANSGILNPRATSDGNEIKFQTNGETGYFSITSPTVSVGLDIYYDRAGKQNQAYLIVARFSDPKNQNASSGFASNFYRFDLTSGRATGNNLFGQSVLFISDIAVAFTAPKVWNGSLSTAWTNPGNWTPVGVPTNADDVFIQGPSSTVLYQPTVGDAEQVLSITLGAGSVLNTQNGGTLNVFGDFINNEGSVTGDGNGAIAFVGPAGQEISGPNQTNFHNLTVNNAGGVTTSSDVSVEQALTLSSGLNIGTEQNFILSSNPTTGTAYVVNNGNNNLLTGNATVQRYIDASGNTGSSGYRHYSSPITSATVNSLTTTGQGGSFVARANPAYNTQDPNTLTLATYPNVFSYDETKIPGSPAVTFSDFDKGYQSPQALSDPLTVGRGYSVQIGNNEKVQFTGQVNNGPVTIGGLTRTGNTDGSGWALVGNPYPAPLDWGTVTGAQLTNVDGAAYVFQSTEAYQGRYTSFNNGVGASNGLIASSQGFFVRASANGGSIALTNANRGASSATKFQRVAAETRPVLRLSLGLGSSPATIATAQDETFVYFEQGATAGFDGRFDAYKLANPSGYYLGTVGAGTSTGQPTNLSIDGRAPLTARSTAETVAVQLKAPAGTYSLTATSLLNFASTGTQVYLRDALLGTLTNLATTPSYSFELAANAASTGRFSLVFGSATALATAPSAALAQTLATLYPNPATGADNVTLAITGLPQDVRQVEATLVNTLGQVVRRVSLAAAQGSARTNVATTGLAGGVYLLRLSAQDAQGQVVGSLPAQRLSLR